MSAHLYLIRGVPGSGKTTMALQMLYAGMVDRHYEADMWMVDRWGRYAYDPKRLSHCHSQCQIATADALRAGLRVVVSNTFTRGWELRSYTSMGYPFTVIRCEGRYPNVHGVSEDRVQDMRGRFEEWQGD